MEDLPLFVEEESDEALANFDNEVEVIQSMEEIDDSELEASSGSDDSDEELFIPSDGKKHVRGLRRFLKKSNASKEAGYLLTQLENRMRQDRATRSLSQRNLMNYWDKK